jgi:hypothetical protein
MVTAGNLVDPLNHGAERYEKSNGRAAECAVSADQQAVASRMHIEIAGPPRLRYLAMGSRPR